MDKSIRSALYFVGFLWIVLILNYLVFFIDFNIFGIYPRSIFGLIGIITWPFLHGGILHLVSNSIPLIVLLSITLSFYNRVALKVITIIIILGGLLVWLFGRAAIHIGASGLIYGLAAFLFASGIFKRDPKSIIIAIIIFLLYGGMIYGVLPVKSGMSWEGHLFGAIAGIFCAYIYRKVES